MASGAKNLDSGTNGGTPSPECYERPDPFRNKKRIGTDQQGVEGGKRAPAGKYGNEGRVPMFQSIAPYHDDDGRKPHAFNCECSHLATPRPHAASTQASKVGHSHFKSSVKILSM